ncbi:CHAP domain-containing protein [Patescibacteria group bacterium]|nr:MAG: CHAP domain-containing protein [Patescibacteria group bacterium]
MVSPKNKNFSFKTITALVLALGLVLAPVAAHAATLEEQIAAANADAARNQQQAATLRTQGDTLANKLAEIAAQSQAIRSQIAANKAKAQKLTQDINDAKDKLALKKQVLDENVRVIYQESKVSPLEMLASSRSFSEYVDRQQYLDTLKDHVQEAAKEVQRQKEELEKQQADLDLAIRNQTNLSQALAIQQNEQSNLLASTRGDEAKYAEQAKASSAKAEELKKQQAAILASRFGGIPSGGTPCGGGYPSTWCNAPKDTLIDRWGMYNRECVSYTAFRVANSGRRMPYWGGRGNAKQWPGNAQAEGIPVDGSPRPGDVAITTAGPYGHAMYVESVSGRMITVSQYNFNNAGEYSVMTIPSDNLYFIHF